MRELRDVIATPAIAMSRHHQHPRRGRKPWRDALGRRVDHRAGRGVVAVWGVGLVLAGPLLGYASWHAYRAAVEPLPASA